MATQAEIDAMMAEIEANRAAQAEAETTAGPRRGVERLTGSADPFEAVRGMSLREQIEAMEGLSLADQMKMLFLGKPAPGREPSANLSDISRREAGVEPFILEQGIPLATETLGQVGGGVAGTALLGPGPGTLTGAATGGAFGAGIGLPLARLATGKPLPSLPEIGQEMALSAGGELLSPIIKGIGRSALRATPQASLLRRSQAAEAARAIPEQVFSPPSRQEIGALFEAVRDTGARFDLPEVVDGLQDLTTGKFNDLLAEVKRLDRASKTGGRWQELVQGLQDGTISTHDIGDLQDLHSVVRKRAQAIGPFEARKLMEDFAQDIDEAIFRDIGEGASGQVAEALLDARRGWAKLRGSEELGDFLENAIDQTSDASMELFSLNRFTTQLRRNKTKLAQAVNRSIDMQPGGRAAFDTALQEIRPLFRVIEQSVASDVAGLRRQPVIGQGLRFLGGLMLGDPDETAPALLVIRNFLRDQAKLGKEIPQPGVLATFLNGLRRQFGGAP